MGLSLLERRIGAVTLSPKAASHAACVGKMENGKFEAVCGVAGRRLGRWRGLIYKPSAAVKTAKNGILKSREFAHMAAQARMLAVETNLQVYTYQILIHYIWKRKIYML